MFGIRDTFPQPVNRIGQKFGGHVSWRTSMRLLKETEKAAIVASKYVRFTALGAVERGH